MGSIILLWNERQRLNHPGGLIQSSALGNPLCSGGTVGPEDGLLGLAAMVVALTFRRAATTRMRDADA
jgi:hypothetical protein